MSRDFDLTAIGLDADDLDLSYDDLPPLPLDRPRYRSRGWWSTTELEDFHLDLPDFDMGAQRMRHTIASMARTVLERTGGNADDAVFAVDGSTKSLNQMLEEVDAMEHERLKAWMDRPR